MKEKIILKTNSATKYPEAPYWSFELPLSELASQLTMEEYWDLGIEMHRLKKDCPTDPECQFCECGHYETDKNGNCVACGGKKPTQKPKIEELELEIPTSKNFGRAVALENVRMIKKINELIKAVNGLYER